ncbi:MAG: PMT-2 domain-containing protein [Oscillospiraceae bacterium]|jgi:hypothetical protein
MHGFRLVRNKIWFCAAAGAILTSAAFGVFHIWYKHYVPWLLSAAGAAACIHYTAGYGNRRTLICTGIYSSAMSAMFLIGSRITVQPPAFEGMELKDIIPFVCLALLLWTVILALFRFSDSHPFPTGKRQLSEHPRSRLFSWLLWSAFLAVAWIPYFLTYYPGLMTGDSFACLVRAAGWDPINNQQPVLYQLFLRVFYQSGTFLGSINRGVALYSFAQLLIMASVLGYALYWCRARGCPLPYLWGVALFFALNPIYGKYAITMWKDVLFGGAILLLTLLLADTAQARGQNLLTSRGLLHFGLVSFAVAFLRNNGIYILVFSFVALAIFCRRHIKKIGPVLLTVLVVFSVIQGPAYRLAGIPKNRFDESVGVPLQQMARVAVKDGQMSEQERAFLDRVIPIAVIKDVYDPFTVDRIKFNHKFDYTYLAQHKSEFFRSWAGMFVKNSKEYIIAHLMETLGYWHIGTGNWVVAPGITSWNGDTYGVVPYNLFGTLTGVNSKPYIQKWSDSLEHFVPIGMSNNIGAVVWLTAFLVLYAFVRRRYDRMVAVAPAAGLWITTMLAAPTYCEFRYVFALFLCAPFLLFIVYAQDKLGQSYG